MIGSSKIGFAALALLLAPQSIIVSYPPGGAGGGYNTIQDEGSGLTTRTTLNFAGAGVACADDTTRTTCTISGGGSGITLREADGTPTMTASTVEMDSADGLTVTDEGAGVGQVDLIPATGAQAGGVSTTTQTFGGDKTFSGALIAGGNIQYSGDTSPAQLTGDQNNYAGCGSTASVCRLDVDATARDITGITNGSDGRILSLVNTTSAGFIYLIDESYNTGSTAANRLALGGSNCLLRPNDIVSLLYDSTSSRWRLTGGSVACGQFHTLGTRHLLSFNPCYSAATGTDDSVWDQTTNGTGAAMNVPLAINSGVCYTSFTLGTVATNRVSATTNLTGGFYFSGGYTTFISAVITGTALSDGTDDYIYYVGALDSVTAEPTDGCFFKYNDGVNAGKWQGVCTNNSTPTTCDTTVTVATSTGYTFGMKVNKGGTSVTFTVNRTNSCTVASNIPITSARAFAFGVSLRKTLGTASRTWYQGPIFVRTDPSAPSAIF